MSVQPHHIWEDIESCSIEIAQYLANLSNWDDPVFPDVEDCSTIIVNPQYFDVTGTWWICDIQITGLYRALINCHIATSYHYDRLNMFIC